MVGYYNPAQVRIDHMAFGLVLQESQEEVKEGEAAGKKKIEKIKTREGKSVKLHELLDEAKTRALAIFKERQHGSTEEESKGESVQQNKV